MSREICLLGSSLGESASEINFKLGWGTAELYNAI